MHRSITLRDLFAIGRMGKPASVELYACLTETRRTVAQGARFNGRTVQARAERAERVLTAAWLDSHGLAGAL